MATQQGLRKQLYWWKQASFAGGELSPDLYARDDFNRYGIGAQEMYNFFAHPFGGFSNRPGTQFLNAAGNSAYAVRLIPFIFSQTQAYVLEFGNYYMRVYTTDGLVVDSSEDVVQITTPYAAADLFDIHYIQSADTLYLCHRGYAPRTLTRSSNTSWTLSTFSNVRGPVQDENATSTTVTTSGTTGTVSIAASSGIFTEDMVGGIMRISHEVYAQSVHYSGNSENTTSSIKVNGDWSFQITDPYAADFTIQISNDNGSTWSTLKTYSCTDASSAVSDSGSTDHFCLLRVYSTATSDGSGSYTLSATAFIDDAYITLTTYGDSENMAGTVYTNTSDYNFGMATNTATTMWSLPAWCTETGFPRCCTFYQDRLVFASTTDQPLNLWFSRTGDYVDFYAHSVSDDNTTYDDDAITVGLVSAKVNAIENLISLGYLLAFTAGGNWKIGSSSSGAALTPTNISAVQQTYSGASSIVPLVLDSRALFISSIGDVINDFAYDIYTDTFKSADMTLFAKHLFRNHSIVDWAYQETPDNLIWAVRDDGVLLVYTYIHDQEVMAWSKHETDGVVESVASIPGDLQNRVFALVKRTINGSSVRYVELLTPRLESDNPTDQVFLDSSLSLDSPIVISYITNASPGVFTTASAHGFSVDAVVDIRYCEGLTNLNNGRFKIATVPSTTTFTLVDLEGNSVDTTDYDSYTASSGNVYACVTTLSGLSHLEGETVGIYGDGNYLGDSTVSSGSVSLDDYVSKATVGLKYTAKMKTLDMVMPRNDGSSTGRIKRISELRLLVKDSMSGFVGTYDYSNMERIKIPQSSILGYPTPLATTLLKQNPYSSQKDEAFVTIKQDIPQPLTVLSITAAVEME